MKDEAKAAPISKVRFVKHFFAFGAMNGRMRYSSMHLFPSLAFLRISWSIEFQHWMIEYLKTLLSWFYQALEDWNLVYVVYYNYVYQIPTADSKLYPYSKATHWLLWLKQFVLITWLGNRVDKDRTDRSSLNTDIIYYGFVFRIFCFPNR